jgi:hypothetical protein
MKYEIGQRRVAYHHGICPDCSTYWIFEIVALVKDKSNGLSAVALKVKHGLSSQQCLIFDSEGYEIDPDVYPGFRLVDVSRSKSPAMWGLVRKPD